MGDVYRGRFAPSPTGPLHFGSLVAALGSCLDARAHGGQWLVRMEDVDTGRSQAGAADDILRTLAQFGFAWDGEVIYQRQRESDYAAVLAALIARGAVYGCACSRKEIADSARREAIDGGLAYPGNCRSGLPPGRSARAWRMRVDNTPLGFEDRLQGWTLQHLEADVGDFVLRRADGLFAYQLAVVVDDHFQGITDVVRGADLLDSTPRQLWLYQSLGWPAPRYAHLPVVANAAGEKLSKQTRAPALDPDRAPALLVDALRFLGQPAPVGLAAATVREVWSWALENWRFERITRRRSQVFPD